MNFRISHIIAALALLCQTFSMSAQSLVESADSAYAADDFAKSTALYLKAAEVDGTSSNLFYNIGNSYYRQGKPGMAILYYERALRLDPSNVDARANLEFVNSRITDEPGDRGMFISNTVNGIACRLSGNVWAGMAIGCFILMLGAVALYIFSANVPLRKVGFFGGFVLLALCVIANVFASVSTRYSTAHDRAVVIDPSTLLSTSPRVPKDRSEEAMLLHEGTCVEILDSVTTRIDSVATKWYDVKVDNNHRAWISGKAVAVI
ncbi:tetratricopeptide repeat protein [uncultured Muribaculum sp.]|uniref:tetratricopeptide repeat protein n=1 Tax=uncultured Muribaculum sp. TaxID=1918613 RepID=UPI0025FB3CF4|nr:tetratricopeptide repeat protein [uncultured Muribaculum sp.]